MSEARTIAKNHLSHWLSALAEWGRLIGPRREQGGEVSLGPLKRPADLELDYVNSLLPPKQFLQTIRRCRHGTLPSQPIQARGRPWHPWTITSVDAF